MARDKTINDSEFSMWRAIFALAFINHVFSPAKRGVLKGYLLKVPFSQEQISILRDDLETPENVVEMYQKIARSEDRVRFHALALKLALCDGKISAHEEDILKKTSCLGDMGDEKVLMGFAALPQTFCALYESAEAMDFVKPVPSMEVRV